MTTPADPRWLQRKAQLFGESRADYIKHLYGQMREGKHQIMAYERFSLRLPGFWDQIAELTDFEKKRLRWLQNELRRVLGR